jgi:hypothetical protein
MVVAGINCHAMLDVGSLGAAISFWPGSCANTSRIFFFGYPLMVMLNASNSERRLRLEYCLPWEGSGSGGGDLFPI